VVEAVDAKVARWNVRLVAPAGNGHAGSTVAAAMVLLEKETRAPQVGDRPTSAWTLAR